MWCSYGRCLPHSLANFSAYHLTALLLFVYTQYRSVSWSTCSGGGGVPTPMFCVLRPGDYANCHPFPKATDLCAQYGRPACTQVWGVHAITVDPVGINANNTGRYFLCTPGRGFLTETRSGLFVTIFHNTDRDYSCAYKINPTGTILVRENSTDRVSFVSFPPTLSPFCTRPSPLFPCITNFKVAPVTLCYTLHFRNWLFFGSSHAYNMKYRSGSC